MNLERRRVRTHPFTTPATGFFRPVRLFTTPRIWPAQKVQIYGTAFFLCCGIEHRQLHGRIGGSVGMRLDRLGPLNDQQVGPWHPCFSKSVRFFTISCTDSRNFQDIINVVLLASVTMADAFDTAMDSFSGPAPSYNDVVSDQSGRQYPSGNTTSNAG